MQKKYMGVDLGALYLKIVVLDEKGEVLHNMYRPHNGRPFTTLQKALKEMKPGPVCLCITGANTDLLVQAGANEVDPVQATVKAVVHKLGPVRNIIDVGGGSLTLIELDEEGNFLNYMTNSLCAAGTGSFLDEQAERLGISYDELSSFPVIEAPPTIAARCTVFAKSDLIHRQQEGCTKEEMWSGLCRGLTNTILQTLFKGRPVEGKTVLAGGVGQNLEVMRWLDELTDAEMIHMPHAHTAGAMGAALLAMETEPEPDDVLEMLSEALGPIAKSQRPSQLPPPADRRPLELVHSKFPDFAVSEDYVDEDETEIRIARWPEKDEDARMSIGIDIGSTSTKCVLMDQHGEIRADLYRKTLGDPIGATKLLFKALRVISEKKGVDLNITSCGTTGSGRKLVGSIAGADAIVNEISCHVTGAMNIDPEIDTIFEIGGQDSKYMHTRSGRIHDSNMNYVCAAGTGSFVEEQSKKLGFRLQDVGDTVMGIIPPPTSDRCTVFMEQDVHKLIRQGYSREEAMAGVMHSVVRNYLSKVVGRRHISPRKVFFQGATARNKGLVAAFENHLNVEIVVSPYCHQMGSIGVAMLAQKKVGKGDTKFRGLGLVDREIKLTHEVCELCANNCRITFAAIDGFDENPSWGYMCGRDAEEKTMRRSPEYEVVRKRMRLWRKAGRGGPKVDKRAPVVGIPRSIINYTFLPLWQRFFSELGFQVRISRESDEEIKQRGLATVGADFCFPIKLAHGHCHQLATEEGVDFIFLPTFVAYEPNSHSTDTHFCPYVQGLPGIVRSALEMNGIRGLRVLSPVVDLRKNERVMIGKLYRDIGDKVYRSKSQIRLAWHKAWEAQAEFMRQCEKLGGETLRRLKEEKRKAIVLIGRPYNLYDPGANVGLPQKIADRGYTVIPLDCLEFDPALYSDDFRNVYWSYGQRILSAMKQVKENDLLYAIYFTNYSCGPDSFLLTYGDQISGDKPSLTLELDEHGADAGYITRVEAFLDVIREHEPVREDVSIQYPDDSAESFRTKTIWIPPMHLPGTRFFAAAFRGHGYRSEALPPEDSESFEIGRSVTRGFECLPTSTTIGVLLKTLRQINAKPGEHAFFMPTAEGPCRFGNYATLHRMILNQEGFGEVPILSPSSMNAYQGVDGKLRRMLWHGMLAADNLLKMRCRKKPYEKHPGNTDDVFEEATQRMEKALERKEDVFEVLRGAARAFASIPAKEDRKPLVGIVGEIYVRQNMFSNEHVIENIEAAGGEAWLAPMSEWIMYTSALAAYHSYRSPAGNFNAWEWASGRVKDSFLLSDEHKARDACDAVLLDRHEPPIKEILEAGGRYVPMEFEGEAILTLGRAVGFARQGAALVVNCSPFGCMPGAITAACFNQLQQELGIPIVSMFYDGEGDLNRRIRVIVSNIRSNLGLPPVHPSIVPQMHAGA